MNPKFLNTSPHKALAASQWIKRWSTDSPIPWHIQCWLTKWHTPRCEIFQSNNLFQCCCPQKEWHSLGNLTRPNAFPREKGGSGTPQLPVKDWVSKMPFPLREPRTKKPKKIRLKSCCDSQSQKICKLSASLTLKIIKEKGKKREKRLVAYELYEKIRAQLQD